MRAYAGGATHPRKRPNGPRPPTLERVDHLNKGLWQCSGQWSPQAKNAKSLPMRSSQKLKRCASDPIAKACSYENSMQAWHASRLSNSHINRDTHLHEDWLRSGHFPGTAGRAKSSDTAAKLDLASSDDNIGLSETIRSTYRDMSANFDHHEGLERRNHHGYSDGGILRRPGSYDKRNCAFSGVTIERPCAGARNDRFLSQRQPHTFDVMRSTDREHRFMPQNLGETIDVRRSN